MFKKTLVVVGTIIAATFAAGCPASASTHHAYRSHNARAMHGIHISHSQAAFRPRAAFRGGSRSRIHAAFRHRGIRFAGDFFPFRRSHFGLRHANAMIRRQAVSFSRLVRSAPALAGASRRLGVQTGSASFYTGGGRTAAGGLVGAATCAHPTLPFGTRVLVTNLANERRAVLTVNDRGPFARGRIVDVSVGAAGTLGMLHSGTAPVRVQVIGGPG